MNSHVNDSQQRKSKKWCGWIPNTSGSISFYTAGRRKSLAMPTAVFSYKIPYQNLDSERHKHILEWIDKDKDYLKYQNAKNGKVVLSFVYQIRDNDDGSFPFILFFPLFIFFTKKGYIRSKKWILRVLYFLFRNKKFNTDFPYFAFYYGSAMSPPEKMDQELYEGVQTIKGTIFSALVPPKSHNTIKKCMGEINKMKKMEKINENRAIGYAGVEERFDERVERLVGMLQELRQELLNEKENEQDKEMVSFAANFKLDRQGILDIDNFQSSDSTEEEALKKSTNRKEPARYYANLLFYFIKDIFHSHSHHSETDDCLSSLHSMPEGSTDIKYKLGCLRRVFQRLTRRYVQMECESVGRDYLIGFLAYIRNLQELVNKKIECFNKRDEDANKNTDQSESEAIRPLHLNYGMVRQSAQVIIERGKTKDERNLSFKQWIYGLFTAFWFLIIQIEDSSYWKSVLDGFSELLLPSQFRSHFLILVFLWFLWIIFGVLFIFVNYAKLSNVLGLPWQEWVYWRQITFQGIWKWAGWALTFLMLAFWIFLYLTQYIF